MIPLAMANSVLRYLIPSSKTTTSGLYRLIFVKTGSGMTEEPLPVFTLEFEGVFVGGMVGGFSLGFVVVVDDVWVVDCMAPRSK